MPNPLCNLLSAALLTGSLCAQLAGVYTINPTKPASGTNYTSLQAAVTALNTAGVSGPVFFDVYDDAGPYTETVNLAITTFTPPTAGLQFAQWTGVSATNRVTFRAAAGESPVIDATGVGIGVFWNGADYVTLEGFEIKNAPVDGISFYTDSTITSPLDPIISGCRIHHCGGSGVAVYGNTPAPTNTLIKNCFFWHLETTNAGSFNTTARFGYITTRRAAGTRVVHNTFFADSGTGAMLCVIGSYTSATTEITYAEVSNNVIVKTVAGGSVFRYQTPSGSTSQVPTVQDSNCVWDTTAGTFGLYGTTGSLSTAATLAAWQTAVSRDLGSLLQDPKLVDVASGDLHLGAGSPCINASVVAAGVTDDIDGQARAGVLDLGADEFSAAKIATVGAGCAGSSALVPVLYAQQWPFIGNSRFAVLTRQTPPNALIGLFLSAGTGSPFNLGLGCNVYLQLATLLSLGTITAGPAGTAGVLLPIPNNPGLIGGPLGIQEVVVDAGAGLGATVTNALGITLGF